MNPKEYEELKKKCLLEESEMQVALNELHDQLMETPDALRTSRDIDRLRDNALLIAQHDKTLKLNNEEWVRWVEDNFEDVTGSESFEQILAIPKHKWRTRKKKLGVE